MGKTWIPWGLVLWVGACGGGGGGGADDGTVPISDLRARLLDTLCRHEVRCGVYPDQVTCAEVFSVQEQVFADVSAGLIGYDGQAAAACLKLYDGLGCRVSDLTVVDIARSPSCRDTFQGTVVDGGRCLVADECVSAHCDLIACAGAMCCTGLCESKVAQDGDCSLAGSACVEGTFCAGTATSAKRVCTKAIAAGQPCTQFDQCVPGQTCNVDSGTGTGHCGNPPTEGQACPRAFCDDSADVCDAVTAICVRRIAVGGACVPGNGTCVPYARCDATAMKCVALAAGGGACSTGTDCITGLACTNGRCTSPPDQPACQLASTLQP